MKKATALRIDGPNSVRLGARDTSSWTCTIEVSILGVSASRAVAIEERSQADRAGMRSVRHWGAFGEPWSSFGGFGERWGASVQRWGVVLAAP